MARILEKRRIHCKERHVDAYVLKWDDGNSSVKCSLLKACGGSCPYSKDPDYQSKFQRAPNL